MSRRIAKEFIDKIYAPDLEHDQDYADKLVDDLEALINKARIETVEELREELNFIKGDYGYEEIKDFLATLKSKQEKR